MTRNLEALADSFNSFCQCMDISKKEKALRLAGRPVNNASQFKGANPYDYYK